jgi:hypothetical protein
MVCISNNVYVDRYKNPNTAIFAGLNHQRKKRQLGLNHHCVNRLSAFRIFIMASYTDRYNTHLSCLSVTKNPFPCEKRGSANQSMFPASTIVRDGSFNCVLFSRRVYHHFQLKSSSKMCFDPSSASGRTPDPSIAENRQFYACIFHPEFSNLERTATPKNSIWKRRFLYCVCSPRDCLAGPASNQTVFQFDVLLDAVRRTYSSPKAAERICTIGGRSSCTVFQRMSRLISK